jgi:hypothetical protein
MDLPIFKDAPVVAGVIKTGDGGGGGDMFDASWGTVATEPPAAAQPEASPAAAVVVKTEQTPAAKPARKKPAAAPETKRVESKKRKVPAGDDNSGGAVHQQSEPVPSPATLAVLKKFAQTTDIIEKMFSIMSDGMAKRIEAMTSLQPYKRHFGLQRFDVSVENFHECWHGVSVGGHKSMMEMYRKRAREYLEHKIPAERADARALLDDVSQWLAEAIVNELHMFCLHVVPHCREQGRRALQHQVQLRAVEEEPPSKKHKTGA